MSASLAVGPREFCNVYILGLLRHDKKTWCHALVHDHPDQEQAAFFHVLLILCSIASGSAKFKFNLTHKQL